MNAPDVSLIDILKIPTEYKVQPGFTANPEDFTPESSPSGASTSYTPLPPPPPPDLSDFEPEPKPPVQELPPPPPPSKPRLTDKEYEESAELCIALLDGIQVLTLPALYQKSMFTKKEFERLKEIRKNEKSAIETTYTEKDQELLEKYKTFEELKKNVEFSPKDVELLKTPLAKVFSKYNIQIGPEFLLLSALAYVATPRYLPLISGLE